MSEQQYNDGERMTTNPRMDLDWKMTTNWHSKEGTISGYNQQGVKPVVAGGGDLTANFLLAERNA